jgi:hypothetical protein
MKRRSAIIFLLTLLIYLGFAQTHDYNLVEIPGNTGYFSSIDIAPDGNTITRNIQAITVRTSNYQSTVLLLW